MSEHEQAIEAAAKAIWTAAADHGYILVTSQTFDLARAVIAAYLAARPDVVLMPRELDDAAYTHVVEVTGIEESSIRLAKAGLVAWIDRRALA